MEYPLPKLPYAENALEPEISAETVSFHYGKHTKGYIENLNKLIAGTPFESEPLETIITSSDGALFNNAAQAWNHIFYFWQFSAEKNMDAHGEIKDAIEKSFGKIEDFKEKFSAEGVSIFGSGWIWLSTDKDGRLYIEKGANADNPLLQKRIPILTFDVWEHAYYLDYQNRRREYLDNIWNILDWKVIEGRYKAVLNIK